MREILACLVMLLLAAPAWAELEVIALKHRSAEELLPIIRPLLDSDDVASGMNNQLILRASQKRIAEIRKLLESLDVAPRRLRITVMQEVDSETVKRLTEVSGSVGIGSDVRISVPGSGKSEGLNVELGKGEDRLHARVTSTRELEKSRNTQQIQVLEGDRALIRRGASVPILRREVIRRPWGTEVVESTEYRQVDSGFYVLPRISGERVTLEVSAQDDALMEGGPPHAIRTRQASTIVSGRLGEWLAVGGVAREGEGDDGTITTRSVAHSQERHNVLIRVEGID